MWPTIFGIKTYSIIYGLAVVVHLVLVLRACGRERISKRAGFLLSVAFLFGMTVGAKILFDLQHDGFAGARYFDWRYIVCGGLWGGPLAYLAIVTPSVMILANDRTSWLDLIARTLVVPMILAKAACFVNGCCYGSPTTVPWAVTFPEGAEAPAGIARHPTQLYEIVVLVAILVTFRSLDAYQRKHNSHRWKGMYLVWFVLFYGLGRPLTELFRETQEKIVYIGPFTTSQLVCLLAAATAGAILLIKVLRPTGSPQEPEAPLA